MLSAFCDLRRQRQRGTGHDHLRRGRDDQARKPAPGTRRLESISTRTTAPGRGKALLSSTSMAAKPRARAKLGHPVGSGGAAKINGLAIGGIRSSAPTSNPGPRDRPGGNYIGPYRGTGARPKLRRIRIHEEACFVQLASPARRDAAATWYRQHRAGDRRRRQGTGNSTRTRSAPNFHGEVPRSERARKKVEAEAAVPGRPARGRSDARRDSTPRPTTSSRSTAARRAVESGACRDVRRELDLRQRGAGIESPGRRERGDHQRRQIIEGTTTLTGTSTGFGPRLRPRSS